MKQLTNDHSQLVNILTNLSEVYRLKSNTEDERKYIDSFAQMEILERVTDHTRIRAYSNFYNKKKTRETKK